MSEAKPKVLVVDDDPGILKQLKWSLLDFEVITADSRESALTQMRLHAPAAVTLDLGLPPDPTNASEGLETLSGILALFPHTKVIVLTGNDDRSNALKAIELGATDFFQNLLCLRYSVISFIVLLKFTHSKMRIVDSI